MCGHLESIAGNFPGIQKSRELSRNVPRVLPVHPDVSGTFEKCTVEWL